jgi:hypothetical protein
MITNEIPKTDLSRPVNEEVIDEIQKRVDSGWRIRTDMELLLKYVRAKLQEENASQEDINATRQQVDRGVR